MKQSVKNLFLGSGVITAIAASLCCVLPVLSVALGLGAFGVASTFETLRPYFLIVAFLALSFGFYQTYFRREKCEDGQACATKPISRFNQVILWCSTILIVAFATFPYYTGYIVSALNRPQPPTAEIIQENIISENEAEKPKTVIIAVEGMTCEGCATQINEELKKLKGVISAEASYKNKNVKVVYNPKLVNLEQIKKAINELGYVAN